MNDCPHWTETHCAIIKELTPTIQFPVTAKTCERCTQELPPRELNPVTARVACAQLKAHGLPVPSHLVTLGMTSNVAQGGVGTELKKILTWFSISDVPGCKCKERAKIMDRWGVEKCKDKFSTIHKWLVEEADRRGIQNNVFTSAAITTAIKLAIWKAERKEGYVSESHIPIINAMNKQADSFMTSLEGSCGVPVAHDPRWFVAFTTAPRKDPTFHTTIKSLRECGWEPHVFAEPGSVPSNATTTYNGKRLGVWYNWLQSCKYAINKTEAEYILTVQDDIILHPQSKEFAETVFEQCVPTGFLSLYTPKHYATKKPVGVNRIFTKSMWGACAIAWRREELKRVVRSEIAKKWLGAPPKKKAHRKSVFARRRREKHTVQNSDTAIGKICNSLDIPLFFVDPSPAQHIAVHSAIGHGGNLGRRNCLRCADFDTPLMDQVFPNGVQDKFKYVPDVKGNERYDAAIRRWYRLRYFLSMCISYDLWLAIDKEVKPEDYTLEFGCGVSTSAFSNGKQHIAIEQNETQASRFRSAQYAPLKDGWYDWTPPRKYRVILVDGPYHGNRGAGLQVVMDALDKDGVIFVDDTHREVEAAFAEQLATRLSLPSNTVVTGTKMYTRVG